MATPQDLTFDNTIGSLINPFSPQNQIFGAGGVTSQIGKAVQPVTDAIGGFVGREFGDLTGTGEFEQARHVTDLQFQQLVDWARTKGLTEEQIQKLIGEEYGSPEARASSDINFESMRDLIEQEAQNNQLQELQTTLLGLGEEEFGARIGRIEGALAAPDIRADPELGRGARDVHNLTIGAEKQAGREASRRSTVRGSGFSGRALDTTLQARTAGAEQRQTAQFQSRGLAQTRLDELRSGKLGFESAVRSGTQANPLDFISPADRSLGLFSASQGRSDLRRAEFLSAATGIGDSLTNAAAPIGNEIVSKAIPQFLG